jgi:hypothetical protein
MKQKFYLKPSDIIPNEIIIFSDTPRRSCFISTVIKEKKTNDQRFNEQYEWLKENHPEYLI